MERNSPAESGLPNTLRRLRSAFDVFHHDEHVFAGLDDIVNASHIIVLEHDGAPGFV